MASRRCGRSRVVGVIIVACRFAGSSSESDSVSSEPLSDNRRRRHRRRRLRVRRDGLRRRDDNDDEDDDGPDSDVAAPLSRGVGGIFMSAVWGADVLRSVVLEPYAWPRGDRPCPCPPPAE
eukprot:5675343-Pyramimonas_sp.AAC.1